MNLIVKETIITIKRIIATRIIFKPISIDVILSSNDLSCFGSNFMADYLLLAKISKSLLSNEVLVSKENKAFAIP